MVGTCTTKAAPSIRAALARDIKALEERWRADAARATRAKPDLQISLVSEHKPSHLAKPLAEVAARVGVPCARHPERQDVTAPIAPEVVIGAIAAEQALSHG